MRSLDEYHGIFTPMLTPLHDDERPDLTSVGALVEYLLAAGVHGIWALGTTGEFASLTADERAAVLGAVVETVRGRVPVIANISDASTRLAIAHGQTARALGVDAVAATPPYYYPNSQDELVAHYSAIRAAVDLPLFIYNIPQTVKVRVEPSTVVTLAAQGAVVGWKDSQNDLEAFRQAMLELRQRGVAFRGLLGSRYLMDVSLAIGGHGGVPATSNVCPRLAVEAYEAARRGDVAAAARWQEGVMAWELLPRKIVKGGSPTATSLAVMKALLVEQGILRSAHVSAPLRPLTVHERAAVAAALPALPTAEPAAR